MKNHVNDNMVAFAIAEENYVRYFAIGHIKNNLFTGKVYGYEGGGESSYGYMYNGKYLPQQLSREDILEDDIAEMFITKKTDINFFKRAESIIAPYFKYSSKDDLYIIKDVSAFKKKFHGEPSFDPPSYMNTTFECDPEYWKIEDLIGLLSSCS